MKDEVDFMKELAGHLELEGEAESDISGEAGKFVEGLRDRDAVRDFRRGRGEDEKRIVRMQLAGALGNPELPGLDMNGSFTVFGVLLPGEGEAISEQTISISGYGIVQEAARDGLARDEQGKLVKRAQGSKPKGKDAETCYT